ncbi:MULTISPECIES: hypothetical protein [Alteromonas]|jgi:hypothetical protein|uniref:XRE family transcriptional regulator n=1 Tax=Alteromonas macleodii TaxID=28108 RepID=A0AB36FKH0_ALTMA|nr:MULTISPECIES: hypothetical protein [Alteromonas]MCG7639312.1 hypothetical protein [Alteromonas sp. CNT1-28]OES23836.1 hypothetical protein BFV95_4921 [Alteromonas macleodii]OES24542.1 hypothetical protein BFV94_4693 [Alteromonas macleodii]OES25177.1 hypothetical protein BFV93_4508 [Alteromonas macleodii]OES38500.1 hypothetical protein BFV96_4911 [Alteromonas macleodii]
MKTKDFCEWIKGIRVDKLTTKEFTDKCPAFHPNTIKTYEKDRLPDVDYLFALHKLTGFSFDELVSKRTAIKLQSLGIENEFDIQKLS